MLLTNEERERFAAYLEQEARSDLAILEQMEKSNMPAALIQKYRVEAMAAQVIAKKLRSTESETIGE